MKHVIYMSFLSICALILGGFLGNVVIGTEGLSWLGYAKTFALPAGTLDLFDVIKVTFGLSLSINVAQIIFLVTAIIIYYKTASKIFG